jgi:hypothetical protein
MSVSSVLGTFKRLVGLFWNNVLDAVNVLWVSRVSAISVVLGAVLFIAIPPVRDTFLETRDDGLDLMRWGFFFLAALLFWALPVHYAARRNIRRDLFFSDSGKAEIAKSARSAWWEIWIPRLLGVACLAAIAVGALMAQNALRVASQETNSVSMDLLRQSDQTTHQTYEIAAFAFLLCIALWSFFTQRTKIFANTSEVLGTVLLVVLLGLFVVLLLIPVQWLLFARAPLIPLLIGGWIPLLALLAYYGRRSKAPLILALFLVLEIAAVYGAKHDVRVLWRSPEGSLSRDQPDTTGEFDRVTLDNAIERWATINNCSDHTHCPRPILVAASGGASRAGFFTAAMLGYLLDRSRTDLKLNDFRNQLFALSTVSGSSAGAAFFAAALRAENKDGSNPCRGPDDSGLVYFSSPPSSWRTCMEQLLAGDFISPTLFSYVFKDAAQGVATLIGFQTLDRAAVLERSWESRFCRNVGPPGCEKEEFKGLEAPFLEVAALDRTKGTWSPLLFFNSTDADTGRRVIVSPIAPHTQKSGDRIFGDAYDLHELLSDRPSSANARSIQEQAAQNRQGLRRDISLSSAALLSARFPLISPPAVVSNLQNKVVARVIDGGYFENFGAATALELANQLKQAGLNPFVIEITNDPELLIADRIEKPGTDAHDPSLCSVVDLDPLCEPDPPINETKRVYWFSDVRGPLSGVFGTRNAHGGQALRSLATFAGPGTAFCPTQGDAGQISFVHIVVHPQYRLSWWNRLVGSNQETCAPVDVPLNWWLSKPVQAYLDDQIEKRNEPAIGQVLKVMEKGAGASALASPSR